ncbi:ArsR/SmtB family transcription factor [Streptomyces sp. NPDC102360]|uniref:ArsR/SmtB family transcription factor n=1 Tax=Streptomyces sp. NPDC102360 TaxID=3366160 RepID=UPI0037FAA94F
MALGTLGGGKELDLSVAAAGNTDVIRAKMRTMETLGLTDKIEDILITLGTQYHLIRPVAEKSGNGPVSVRDLLIDIDIEPSNLSQQLAVLRRSGIVVSTREGTTVAYALAGGDVAELLRAARRILTELLAGQIVLLAELQDSEQPERPTAQAPP